MLEKMNQVVLLFDFYGELLTSRQRHIFKLYYYEDFSLGEIAELENISRQAVHDLLQRVEEVLWAYEDKLRLVSMFKEQQKKLFELKNIISKYKEIPRNECLKLLEELIRGEV